jgi:hypothetical protein
MGTTGNKRKMQGEEVLTLACCCMSGCAVTDAVTVSPAINQERKTSCEISKKESHGNTTSLETKRQT